MLRRGDISKTEELSMKVFEVITEHYENNSDEAITSRRFVMSEADTIKSVFDYEEFHCQKNNRQLMSVRQLLEITDYVFEDG